MFPLNPSSLVLVGGFLGAGKTTLILKASKLLESQGLRCAYILNDQSDELVDTAVAQMNELMTREVTGGCFCCRFSSLAESAKDLYSLAPNVIFAEPVGSCTDLVATVIKPLSLFFPNEFRVAPLTVLVDPGRYREAVEGTLPTSMSFLIKTQLQEADIVAFTKSDLYSELPPIKEARQLSSVSGQGVEAWLDEVLAGELRGSGRALAIDYEKYAEAEAGLVWCHVRCTLVFRIPSSAHAVIGHLLGSLDAECYRRGATIAHAKAVMTSDRCFLKAAVSRHGESPRIEGDLLSAPSIMFGFLLNLRAEGEYDKVVVALRAALDSIPATRLREKSECFHPSAPVPEHRITS